MKTNKSSKTQTDPTKVVDFLNKYNFSKLNYLLKKDDLFDHQILKLSVFKKRGRPQSKDKKPKNKVIEELREFYSIKESLDVLLDHLLTHVAFKHEDDINNISLYKTEKAFTSFKEGYLNAAISYSTMDSCSAFNYQDKDLSTQKAFILDFPYFNEINVNIQLQIQHYIHFNLDMNLITESCSFKIEALRDIKSQQIICPYYVTSLFIIFLSTICPMDVFKGYLYVIYLLIKINFKKFNIFQRNLSVNLNIPKTLAIVNTTNFEEFKTFYTDFFAICDIYLTGQSCKRILSDVGNLSVDDSFKNKTNLEIIKNVVRAWKLTFDCVSEIFFE